MSAGTIALTNNSANVTGTGTAFTTDLKAGDFVVVIIGGVTYTLGVKAITSATALTLITAYGGPTATGNAWTAVPNATLVGITSQVAADVAKAIRGLNLDKANWQKIFSSDPSVTVTRPDLSTFTGPSWGSLSDSLAGKAAKGANTDITSLAGLTTALSVTQGGTGAKTATAGLSNLGGLPVSGGTSTGVLKSTSAFYTITSSTGYGEAGFQFPGTLQRLAYGYTENYGDYVFVTTVAAGAGSEKYFAFRQNGNMTTQGNISCVSLTQTSDIEKKDKITPIENALDKINAISGVTFIWKGDGTPSAGIIAQELKEVLPESIGTVFEDNDQYGVVEEEVQREVADENGVKTIVTETVQVTKLIRKRDDSKRSYTVEYSGVIALAVQAIKELSEKVTALEAYIGPENLAAMSKEPTS
ncbi:tail fiber domain-containing protein [Rahnella variigena]|uniref:tail fiber domain-containing protein n=1 Tax=Rahnella variigena TaxID=574964 RepID=UPI003CF7097C